MFGKLAVETFKVLWRNSDYEFEFVINNLFDGNSGEASISEQDAEGRFVLVEFVLGNGRMFDQSLNTKLSDQLSLRHS